MNICVKSLILVGTLPVLGLSTLTAVTAQPYGNQPYGNPAYGQAGYPRGYQQPRPEAPSERAEGSVTILSPEENAVVSSMQPLVLEYHVKPGPQGDHVHVYLDGSEVAILRQLKGTYSMGRLHPGAHKVAIKVVNRQHVPIGIEQTVAISVR